MKFTQTIAIGVLSAAALAVSAQQQQQSPFTPAVGTQAAIGTQATAGGPIVLNLSGVTVTDQAGQPVGPIQHILLSPAGCVDMAVMSLGGQKLVAVPWTLVSGAGAARGEADVAGRAALALKVDRAVLLQAPAVTSVHEVTQPQMIQQVTQYFSQYQTQTGVGSTGSQTNIVGGTATNTNRFGSSLTNPAGVSVTGTNQTGILSPTGPTNAAPGRPAFETNRPGQPSIIPPGRENRPPFNRPPTNRPPLDTPGTGTPGTPRSGQQ